MCVCVSVLVRACVCVCACVTHWPCPSHPGVGVSLLELLNHEAARASEIPTDPLRVSELLDSVSHVLGLLFSLD